MSSSLDDAAIQDFIDLAFEFACTRPLSDFVDAERVVASLDQSLTPERVAQWQTRIFNPMRERLIERASKSALKLGAWLPADVTAALSDMLGEPAPIPRKLVDELVASERVRDEVRTMLQDSLTNFISKATGGGASPGGGGPGGIRGAIGLGARVAGAAGRGLLGGLGEEFQKQLQGKVREFVDGSMSALQSRVAEKLKSEQTAKDLGKRRRTAFLTMLDRTEAEAAKVLRNAPHARIDPMVPRVVSHNLARTEVRDALRDEIAAALAELSTQRVGELLDQAGLRELARDALCHHGLAVGRDLARTPAFVQWWSRNH